MNAKVILWFVELVLGAHCAFYGSPDSPFDEKADTLSAALLPTVSYIATWPGKDVLAGPGRVPVEKHKDVASHSIYWLEKVVNATMRPITNKTFRQSLILLEGGMGTPNVVRVQWTKDGYRFQVSQSAAVMTIRVVPPAGSDPGQTVEAKRRYAANLAGRVFADTDTRAGHDAQQKPTRVAVRGLARKIITYSFRPAKMRALKDAVVGAPVTKEDEGVMPPHGGAEIDAENRADNRHWDRSSSSWGYWWRHVSWWNDGKSVGFVMLKCEAGPIRVDYASPELNQWFAPRKAKPPTQGGK
jgi:hypothetical protein